MMNWLPIKGPNNFPVLPKLKSYPFAHYHLLLVFMPKPKILTREKEIHPSLQAISKAYDALHEHFIAISRVYPRPEKNPPSLTKQKRFRPFVEELYNALVCNLPFSYLNPRPNFLVDWECHYSWTCSCPPYHASSDRSSSALWGFHSVYSKHWTRHANFPSNWVHETVGCCRGMFFFHDTVCPNLYIYLLFHVEWVWDRARKSSKNPGESRRFEIYSHWKIQSMSKVFIIASS